MIENKSYFAMYIELQLFLLLEKRLLHHPYILEEKLLV
jgi:hypothetical protein